MLILNNTKIFNHYNRGMTNKLSRHIVFWMLCGDSVIIEKELYLFYLCLVCRFFIFFDMQHNTKFSMPLILSNEVNEDIIMKRSSELSDPEIFRSGKKLNKKLKEQNDSTTISIIDSELYFYVRFVLDRWSVPSWYSQETYTYCFVICIQGIFFIIYSELFITYSDFFLWHITYVMKLVLTVPPHVPCREDKIQNTFFWNHFLVNYHKSCIPENGWHRCFASCTFTVYVSG